LSSVTEELTKIEESIKSLNVKKNEQKNEIEFLSEQNLDKQTLMQIYSDFKSLFDLLSFDEKQTAIRLLIREIVLEVHKDYPEKAKIKMALWNHSSTEPILLSKLESSSLRRTWLRRAGEKTNRIILSFKIRYMQYKQCVTYYYFPQVSIENGRLNVVFYRNRGRKGVKFSRDELQKYWQVKSTARAVEFEKMLNENNWSKADLARHLGVSRVWVTMVLRELG